MNVQSWIVLLLFMTLMGYILFRQIRLIASGKKKCNACTVTVCPMNEPVPAAAEADCIAGNAMMVHLGVTKEGPRVEKHCPTSQVIKD
ncbi:hypothetical protein C8U37_11933 [Trichococcus patagoniensis]|uniref:Uncharacterized protein n=1 Tax=Trichococcus patagoniensis TaxID=382641 RepID=A0A2T5IDV0_9LACT|nr:hypothetical protein [Trichococcus patagoniensis]PTQ82007.1 hypothetical protein C8U37_11933 [Trichococcus patagoniensis]